MGAKGAAGRGGGGGKEPLATVLIQKEDGKELSRHLMSAFHSDLRRVYEAIQHRGFLKYRGTILGVPLIGIKVFWGLCWGPLILGNYHIDSSTLLAASSCRKHQSQTLQYTIVVSIFFSIIPI